MTESYDSGDLDALLELEQSAGYALVRGRMEAALERGRIELETCSTLEKFTRLQGQLAGLRLALAIPGILKAEIRSQLQEQ